MKIKFKKFDKGVFYLEYLDEDLLLEPIEVKLINYNPKLDKPFNIRIDNSNLAHMDKSVLASFVELPRPEDMTVDEIIYMLSDMKVDRDVIDEECIDKLAYTQFIDASKIIQFICNEINIVNITRDNEGSVLFTLPGLKLNFNLKHYRATLTSSFKMIGKSNSLINYYLTILDLYLSCINLEES